MGSAFLHVARNQERFQEREIISLQDDEEVSEDLLRYIIRLRDTLYAMSRYEDEVMGEEEEQAKECFALTDELSEAIIDACAAEAKRIGKPMVITIVDDGGNLKAMKRMDGAIKGSIDISKNKAYTAAFFRLATEELGKMSAPGEALYGIEITNRGQVVTFAGGMPIESRGVTLGGLGISGGSVEEDKAVCLAGLKILKARGGE